MRASLIAISLLAVGQGVAQEPRERGGGGAPLEIGSKLPDVVAYDEKGEKFPLRQKLKGRHAVIVFGCLT